MGVLTTPRGLANENVSENHVWLLLLHTVILSLENFRKMLRKIHFYITIMVRKSMKDSYILKMPVPEQRLTFIPMNVTVDDVIFCDILDCVYIKYKSCASTAGELPD